MCYSAATLSHNTTVFQKQKFAKYIPSELQLQSCHWIITESLLNGRRTNINKGGRRRKAMQTKTAYLRQNAKQFSNEF